MPTKSGSLLIDIRAQTLERGERCATRQLLDSLSAEDRQDIETALKEGVSVASVARALALRGAKITAPTMNRHYRKECACGRAS
jgi:hypothetical protein